MDWKEFTINEAQAPVVDYCASYDVVAFSCYIWNITQTLQVAQKIKQKNPNTQILLGGHEVSYEYNAIIALDYIDYIIVDGGSTDDSVTIIKKYERLLRENCKTVQQDGLTYFVNQKASFQFRRTNFPWKRHQFSFLCSSAALMKSANRG